MKGFRLHFCLIVAAGYWAAAMMGAQPEASPRAAPEIGRYHERRILALPKSEVGRAVIRNFHASQKSRVLKRFGGLQNLEVIEIAEGQSVATALEAYGSSGLFEFVEPDFFLRLAFTTPNDPKFVDGTLWGLHNTGQAGGLADADLDGPEAWTLLRCANRVVVAVVDSGVRYTHEDLVANLWRHPVTGAHGLNALAGTDDPDDDHGHGTVMAGIVGAAGNNGIGVVGVAWQVQIMACKFTDRFGVGNLSDAIACLDFARTNGADIINASWGMEDYSLSLSNAVRQAREAGIIVVAAAGNRNPPSDNDVYPFYPASLELDNVISVAATTRNDELYILSNYGATSVDLAAPGVDIHSTHHRSNNAYTTRSGTSTAAAHVSGAMALMRSRFPADDHGRLIQRLLNATDPLPSLLNKCVTGGRLNLFKALSVSSPSPTLTVRLANPNQLELHVSGEPWATYVVQATGDFVCWSPVVVMQAGRDGFFAFTNTIWTNWPAQFFKTSQVEP